MVSMGLETPVERIEGILPVLVHVFVIEAGNKKEGGFKAREADKARYPRRIPTKTASQSNNKLVCLVSPAENP